MIVTSYQDLTVWQKSIDLAQIIYELTRTFPKQETYGIVIQMRRAAISIPSNIAEGHVRESTKEYLHHLSFARGSVAELETQIILSCRLRYVEETVAKPVLQNCNEIGKMIRAIQKRLRKEE